MARDDERWDVGWVTAEGGAMDRVAVFCAVLLGLCAALMVAVTIAREIWVGVGFWALLLLACIVFGRRTLRRVRGAGRSKP
ncbi:hypothetical protein [Aeromicrobium sp. CTD01-1L150]|uniref:hypothetical protein n=1 Tax=Aeromicrobium sp. CTD01-1L150 TaxID=3341830 RepID=UPI0035BF1AF3